ncbi:hypothetical protein CRG98_045769 [Punica granatum]|uniref:Uncharacterized protein n=1 Tax=Punica granatum TaxID=22663 RepID=A0A2I0HQ67_PUNGR|nr:hypothetical protein CRG98_045769 [Punica granatum]
MTTVPCERRLLHLNIRSPLPKIDIRVDCFLGPCSRQVQVQAQAQAHAQVAAATSRDEAVGTLRDRQRPHPKGIGAAGEPPTAGKHGT